MMKQPHAGAGLSSWAGQSSSISRRREPACYSTSPAPGNKHGGQTSTSVLQETWPQSKHHTLLQPQRGHVGPRPESVAWTRPDKLETESAIRRQWSVAAGEGSCDKSLPVPGLEGISLRSLKCRPGRGIWFSPPLCKQGCGGEE